MSTERRLHLHFDPRGDLLEEARACESEVFLQWYGNTPEQLRDEYGEFEAASVFLALADDDGFVLGAARLISPNAGGLKTLADVQRAPWRLDGARSAAAAGLDVADTWDVATLGVREGLTGPGVRAAAALYHGLVLAGRANEVPSFVAILDDRLRRLLLSMGIVLHTLPGSSSGAYLGSPRSTPVYAHFGALLDHQRRIAPEDHRLISLGHGLGLVPPDLRTFALRPRVLDLTVGGSADLPTTLTDARRGQPA